MHSTLFNGAAKDAKTMNSVDGAVGSCAHTCFVAMQRCCADASVCRVWVNCVVCRTSVAFACGLAVWLGCMCSHFGVGSLPYFSLNVCRLAVGVGGAVRVSWLYSATWRRDLV